MKAISSYTIGNTAVKIIDNGRRIRVVDVEKETRKKNIHKHVMIFFMAAFLTLSSSLFMVSYQHSKTVLDKKIYTLKTEIDSLERENIALEKSINDKTIDYDKIYREALAMGMHFPKSRDIRYYSYHKGSAIRLYEAPQDVANE